MFRVLPGTPEDFISLCVDDIEGGGSSDVFLDDSDIYKLVHNGEVLMCLAFEPDDFGEVYVQLTVSKSVKRYLKSVICVCKDVVKYFPKKTYCIIESDRKDLVRFANAFGYYVDRTRPQVLLYDKRYDVYTRK